MELAARIHVVVRQIVGETKNLFLVGQLNLDHIMREVTCN